MWVYGQNLRVAVIVVSLKSCLTSREGIGGNARGMQSHAHQGNRFSLPSGNQHVHFTTRGLVVDFVGQPKEFVCLLTHSAYN